MDLPTDDVTTSRIVNLQAKFNRCALIGASPLMKGMGHGVDIDDYDVVIRINRIPTPEFHQDFGSRTDILYANSMDMYTGNVSLMGGGDDVKKKVCSQSSCDYLGMIFRGDYGCEFDKLQSAWGKDTGSVLGCTTRSVTKIAYAFKLLQNVEPTSGFMAFLTFAPLCHQFILYGFSGDGAIDGHTEWEGHSLYYEHIILNAIADGRWNEIETDEAHDWLLEHLPAGIAGVKVVVVQH